LNPAEKKWFTKRKKDAEVSNVEGESKGKKDFQA
jgi:hypothetical protein